MSPRSLKEMRNNSPVRRPRVLAILPSFIPSTLIHVVKPLLGLHRAGCIKAGFALEHSVFHHSLERAEVVVFCRNTEPAYGWILDFALARGKPVVYDLDDNFFELPLTSDIGRYHRAPERLEQLERYLRTAALVRVYSEPLLQQVRRLNPNVVRVEGPIDWSLIPIQPKRQDSSILRVVYPTSRVEDELAELFLADIRRLLSVYAGQLEMFFWGYHPRELRGHPAVRFIPPIANYDRFFRKFARFGFDIGVAPLRDDIFHRSKSDVKFREYAACGIAGVYSNVGAYAKCVKHEETGLLVSNQPGAWFDAISRLLKDVDLRHGIQKQAREYARNHYDLRLVEEVWWSQLQRVTAISLGDLSSFSAQRHRRPGRFPADSHPGTHLSGKMAVTKLAWACWARRAYKVVHTLRQSGFRHTVDRTRQSLNNLTMLLHIRIKLQRWSVFRRMLRRGATRPQWGISVQPAPDHQHPPANRRDS